jgi:voltage-gated sodium channel
LLSQAGRKKRLAEQIEDLNNIRLNNAVLSIIGKVNESRKVKEQNRINQLSSSRGNLGVNDVTASSAKIFNKLLRTPSQDGSVDSQTDDALLFNDNGGRPQSASARGVQGPDKRPVDSRMGPGVATKVDANPAMVSSKEPPYVDEVAAPSKIEVATNAKMRKINEMTGLLIEAWRGSVHAQMHYEEIAETLTPVARRLHAMKLSALRILNSNSFHVFLVLLIAVSSMLVGIELDMSSADNENIFYALERFIVTCFCIELCLRIVAVEFDLLHFFYSPWNCFDALVIVGSMSPGTNVVLLMWRLLRVFRILRLLKMFPQLQTIVQALISGIASIRYVGAIIAFSFYVFGLIGVFMFRENDPEHFGQLDLSLITLLSVVTLDNWGDIMYRNMYGCSEYPPPMTVDDDIACVHSYPLGYAAAAYFIIFIIINTFVLLTLFVGVVTTAMEAAASEKRQQLDEEEALNALITAGKVSVPALDLYKRVFTLLDTDGSGSIEIAEIQMGLSCVKFSPSNSELQDWLTQAGLDPIRASYSLVDFVSFMLFMKRRASLQRLKDSVGRVVAMNKEQRPIEDMSADGSEQPSLPAASALSIVLDARVSDKLVLFKNRSRGMAAFLNRKIFSSVGSDSSLVVADGDDHSQIAACASKETQFLWHPADEFVDDGPRSCAGDYEPKQDNFVGSGVLNDLNTCPPGPVQEDELEWGTQEFEPIDTVKSFDSLDSSCHASPSIGVANSLPTTDFDDARENCSGSNDGLTRSKLEVVIPLELDPSGVVSVSENDARPVPMVASNTLPLTNTSSFNEEAHHALFTPRNIPDFLSDSRSSWTKRSFNDEGNPAELPVFVRPASSKPVIRSIVAI